MFVALNPPVDASGNPLQGPVGANPQAPRVWQSWQSPDQVFPGNGIDTKFCAANKKGLVLLRTSKFSTKSFIKPFTTSPLIDQTGNYVVYDIRMNTVKIDYLSNNGLLTKSRQEKFSGTYNFPTGQGSTQGALRIKTAWRILTDPASFGNFYTTPGMIVVPAANSVTKQEMCLDVTVGLVGMHIMQKITNPQPYSNFWVWATFEHKDNAPTAQNATPSQTNANAAKSANPYYQLTTCAAPTVPATAGYSFFSPVCSGNGAPCTPNQKPTTDDKNGNFIWQAPPPYAKNYLTNTTQETYLRLDPIIVGGRPRTTASGSCITCHNLATDKANKPSNFSFLLGDAK